MCLYDLLWYSDQMHQARTQLMAKVLLTLLTLIMLELVLRLANYPYLFCRHISTTNETELGQFDSDLGWRWRESQSFSGQGVTYHFDSVGLRTAEFGEEVDFSKPRILFIGDSVTFGFGLNYRQTFPAKIGELLDHKFSIVNAAVEGYGSDQAYLRMQQVINYVRPSVIVATFIADHNDRNLNRDRRQVLRCFEFSAYKPVPALFNGELVLRSPAKPVDQRASRVLMAATDVYDRLRHSLARETGYDIAVSRALMRAIATTELDGNTVPAYFIYYDAQYSTTENYNDLFLREIFTVQGLRVLPFYNWSADSDQAKYYAKTRDDFHPSDLLTNWLAEAFMTSFGSEITGLSGSSKDSIYK